ncbi:MAG: hypothetical protein H6715_06220 [Myxococcales bacterium]|nr:hypothetical protein [Myxococcales bacterium]
MDDKAGYRSGLAPPSMHAAINFQASSLIEQLKIAFTNGYRNETSSAFESIARTRDYEHHVLV